MPHPAPHHRQMFLARTPSRARRLALGMCLAASLALSACGPAHKGQLKVSRCLRRGQCRGQRIQLARTVQVTEPDRLGVDALPFGNDMDGTECHGLQ